MRGRNEFDSGDSTGGKAGSVRITHELVEDDFDGPTVGPEYQSLYDEVQRYRAVLRARLQAFLVTDLSNERRICEAKLDMCGAVLDALGSGTYAYIHSATLGGNMLGWDAGIRSKVARFVRQARNLLPEYAPAQAGVHVYSRATPQSKEAQEIADLKAHISAHITQLEGELAEHDGETSGTRYAPKIEMCTLLIRALETGDYEQVQYAKDYPEAANVAGWDAALIRARSHVVQFDRKVANLLTKPTGANVNAASSLSAASYGEVGSRDSYGYGEVGSHDARAAYGAHSARATVAPEKGTLANKVEAHGKRIASRMNMLIRERGHTDNKMPTREQLARWPRASQKHFAIWDAKVCVLEAVYKLLTCGEDQNAIDTHRQQLETECDKPAHEGLWDKGIHSKVAGFVKEAKVLCPTRKELELVRDSKGGTPMHAGW